jgi:hypothetical protein
MAAEIIREEKEKCFSRKAENFSKSISSGT